MRVCSSFTSGPNCVKRVQVFFLLEDCIQQTTIYLPIDKAHRQVGYKVSCADAQIAFFDRITCFIVMSDVNLFEQSNHIKIERIIIYIN